MPYAITYKGQEIEFPNEQAAIGFLKAAQQTSTKKESRPEPSPSPVPTPSSDLTPPTSVEPSIGAFDRLTAAAKVALSPSSQAQIGPATSPIRETPTVTATEALTSTKSAFSPGSALAQGFSAMSRVDDVARALAAGPGPSTVGGPYKTTGAKVVEALIGRGDVTPKQAVKGLVDSGYLNNTIEADFNSLPELAQEILTSPTSLLTINPASKVAPKVASRALKKFGSVERELTKQAAKEIKVADNAFTKMADDLDFLKPLDEITSGGGAVPPLNAVNPSIKEISKFRFHTARLVASPTSVMKKLGESGKVLVDKFENVRFTQSSRLGSAENTIKKFISPLSPNEKDNFVDVLDKGLKPLNERVQLAVDNIKPLLEDVRREATKKLPNFRPVETYYPHIRPKEVIEYWLEQSDELAEEAQKLVRAGVEPSLGDAVSSLLRGDKYRTLEGFRPSSNLEYVRRMQGGEYLRNPEEALSAYFSSAYRRLAEVDEFGLADKKVNNLLKAVKEQFGKNAEQYMEDTFKAFIGDYKLLNRAEREIAGTLGTVQVVTKLGLAQIANLGQSANTAIRTNFSSTLKGLREAFTQEGKEFARSAGAFADSIAEELAGQNSVGNSFLKLIGFKSTEMFNRGIAAVAGKNYALQNFDDLFKEASKAGWVKAQKKGFKILNPAEIQKTKAYQSLKELGLSVDDLLKKGYVDLDSQKRAAYRVVQDTQFGSHPENLPLFWQNPTAKLAVQFKTFAFQHSKFMKDFVFKKAAQGDLKPMMRAVIASATFGEVVRDVKETTRTGFKKNEFINLMEAVKEAGKGNIRPILDRQLDNFFQLGGFGLYADMIQSAQYGRGSVERFLGGPTLSDLGDIGAPLLKMTGETLKSAWQLESPDSDKLKKYGLQLGKELTRRIPIAGPPLKNTLFNPTDGVLTDTKKSSKKPFAPKRESTTKKKKPFG